jgi:hypothetical protein
VGTDDCEVRKSTRLFFWEIREHIKRRDLEKDVVIINVNKVLFRHLRAEGYLRIPDCVKSVLMLPGTFEEVKGNLRGSALRKVRQVSAKEYTCAVLHEEPALQHFYHEMYVPYLRKRFGGLADIDSYYKARRIFRTGFLVAVRKGNDYLSGAICRIREDAFIFELVGIEKGDLPLLREGALDALYYYCILLAIEKKCAMINFGLSRPFLNDGLVIYKRKWGTVLTRNRKQYREIGIRFNGSRRSGYHYLLRNYPVFLDNKSLCALVTADGAEPVDMSDMRYMINMYCHPGLERLVLLSPRGFDEEVEKHYVNNSGERVKLVTMAPEDWDAEKFLARLVQ